MELVPALRRFPAPPDSPLKNPAFSSMIKGYIVSLEEACYP